MFYILLQYVALNLFIIIHMKPENDIKKKKH